MASRFIKGTLILTVATFLSKFLGMIYIIPFNYLVGLKGGALYSYAYVPYMILISLSTMGIPLGVSKFVAKYNTLGDYRTSQRLFRSGLVVMTIAGVLAWIILYALAPELAPFIIDPKDKTGNTVEDVTYVIRMVSFALILVPPMSLIRGYFQGHESMTPTAVSQVVEQIVRIAAILIGAYLILKVYNGTISEAVGFSTFAAFIGAVAGMGVLVWFWLKKRKQIHERVASSTVTENISLGAMYKELITYAIPFVFVGISMPLYQMIDQFTFNHALRDIGVPGSVAEASFSIINNYGQKLVMIPVSLATAMSLTLIPVVTKAYTERKMKTLNRYISQTLQMILFLTVPAAIGISVISEPIYGFLFGKEDAVLGGTLLAWYSPVAILFALYSVTTALLQGINAQKYVIFSLSGGLLLKLVLNVPLIHSFGALGSIFATAIGYVFAIGTNLILIRKFVHYSQRLVLKRSLLVLLFTGVMALSVWLVIQGMNHTFSQAHEGYALKSIIGSIVGGLVYVYLVFRSHLAEKILGEKINIFNRFKRKTKANVS